MEPARRPDPIEWDAIASPVLIDPHTYGFEWKTTSESASDDSTVTLPEYFRLEQDADGRKRRWKPVPADAVPAETGLREARLGGSRNPSPEPYVTPDAADSCWKSPGPVAGPFQAELGDGSVVTYSWYRFADQPAILNADLTPEEREELQRRVVQIHKTWKSDRDYLPPPTTGRLAAIDPALIVTPPSGLEAGYVPIVTRQELKK